MTNRHSVPCPYCQREAVLLPDSVSIYGRDRGPLWICRPCGAWVGCHPGTYNPLGRLADAQLRQAKMAAHAAFDRLWKGAHKHRKQRRTEAYTWLARAMGIPREACHIGMMDVAQCQKVVELAGAEVANRLKKAIKLARQ